jgi:uncharacterized membrane protein YGL010W
LLPSASTKQAGVSNLVLSLVLAAMFSIITRVLAQTSCCDLSQPVQRRVEHKCTIINMHRITPGKQVRAAATHSCS